MTTTNEHVMTRRDELASAVITAWVVTGLFLDGWAHNAEKPETFFTPWHGLLYAGFAAGVLWGVLERARARRLGEPVRPMPALMRVGFACFAVGGVADMIWHGIFGVEADVEALVSPTHLLLMVGGLLLTTGTVRSALGRGATSPTLRDFAPALTGVALAVAVVGFFVQFSSAFRIEDHAGLGSGATEGDQVQGMTSLLLTNILLVGAVAWTLRRFRPPRGTFAVLLTVPAVLLASQHGFDELPLAGAALVAGLVADALVARGTSDRSVLLTTPLVLWTGWFAIYHAVWGLGWPVEIWTGPIVLAILTGFGLSLLADAGPSSVPTPIPTEVALAADPAGAATPRSPRTPYRALAELLV
ncbi:MAG: hypothetical protein HYU28_09865 [Actinobacteria bacterium]|nr:hypothetical protein [Actinomycetota bacterium]